MKKGFKTIITRRFGVLLILLMVIITLLVSERSYSAMLQQTINSKERELSLINRKINSILSYTRAINNNIYYNDYIYNYLKKEEASSEDNIEITFILKLLKGKYRSIFRDFGGGFEIVLIGKNGIEGYSGFSKDEYNYDRIKNSGWFRKSINGGEEIGESVNNVIKFNGKIKNCLIQYRNVYSVVGKEYLGTLCIVIDAFHFQKSYSRLKYEFSSIYLFNDNNEFFFINDDNSKKIKIANDLLRNNEKEYTLTNDYLVIKDTSDETGWSVVELISLDSIKNQLYSLVKITCFICLIAFFIGIIIVRVLSKLLTRPLKEFCDILEMDNLEKFNNRIEKDNNIAEIDQLYNSYNKMNARNNDLINELIKNENDKRLAELNYMRAQINPHFIYNTLFSIKCTIDMDRKAEAVKMIDILNDMLRRTLKFKEETTTVGEEIMYIHSYIKMLQFSYEKKLTLKADVSDEVRELRMLRFILQPIVENAIFHGIQPKNEDGEIIITAMKRENEIELAVHDNGIGFSKERLKEVTSPEYISRNKSDEHIGVVNVHNRIRSYYGDEYGIKIDSQQGEGTTIFITLPIIGVEGAV